MKTKFICLFVAVIASFFAFGLKSNTAVKADELSDAVRDQVDNLDLSDAETFFNGLNGENIDFLSVFGKILKGEFDGADNFFDYLKNLLFSDFRAMLPIFSGVIAAVLLCEILRNSKSTYLSSNVHTVVKLVSLLTATLILATEFVSIWQITQNVINNISKFSEIMSPVILTLMIASGGTASAAIYKPSVMFFTDTVIIVFRVAVLPIIGIFTVFNVLSHFNGEIKLKKFADFFGSVLKWIFGITVVVYGFLITVQGLSVSTVDGVSAKIAKYAVSNSVPIVGGMLKDGLDVIAAGSVIIKNAFGIAGVICVFYFLLAPVARMVIFSLLLKLSAAVIDVCSDGTTSDFLQTLSKSVSYFIAAVLTVGLMAFLTVLLMVFSANAAVL